jgi:plasmid stabilization system protein ParE
MANYRLSREAESDLYQIWLFGLSQFGAEQADSPATASISQSGSYQARLSA